MGLCRQPEGWVETGQVGEVRLLVLGAEGQEAELHASRYPFCIMGNSYTCLEYPKRVSCHVTEVGSWVGIAPIGDSAG